MFLSRVFKPERRRSKRQLFNTSVRVLTDSGSIEAVGINVSDLGMCLFTAAHLPIGSQVELEFLPQEGTAPTRVNATVRHRALYLYGIEFDSDSKVVTNRPAATPFPASLD